MKHSPLDAEPAVPAGGEIAPEAIPPAIFHGRLRGRRVPLPNADLGPVNRRRLVLFQTPLDHLPRGALLFQCWRLYSAAASCAELAEIDPSNPVWHHPAGKRALNKLGAALRSAEAGCKRSDIYHRFYRFADAKLFDDAGARVGRASLVCIACHGIATKKVEKAGDRCTLSKGCLGTLRPLEWRDMYHASEGVRVVYPIADVPKNPLHPEMDAARAHPVEPPLAERCEPSAKDAAEPPAVTTRAGHGLVPALLSLLSDARLRELEREVAAAINGYGQVELPLDFVSSDDQPALERFRRPARTRLLARFRHPTVHSLVWCGIGRRPRWLNEFLEKGGSLAQLRIGQ